MKQAAFYDRLVCDASPFFQNRLTSPEVNVRRGEVRGGPRFQLKARHLGFFGPRLAFARKKALLLPRLLPASRLASHAGSGSLSQGPLALVAVRLI